MDKLKMYQERDYDVCKANEIIRKGKNMYGVAELRTLSYMLSKIKPTDKAGQEYFFSIKEYCQVCGIATKGNNYAIVKESLRKLHEGFWLKNEKGHDVLYSWIDRAEVSQSKGTFTIKFDDRIQQYLFNLNGNYTQYSLIATLPMKSAYSFKIYEILKSYAYKKSVELNVDELKEILMAKCYENFKDFRKRVVEVAVEEINMYSDLRISWEPIKESRKVKSLKFEIETLDTWGMSALSNMNNKILDRKQIKGQMTIFDFVSE